MSDWLPIEDAPKDGTLVLLKCPGNRQAVASWVKFPLFSEGWYVSIPCMGGWGQGNDCLIHWEEDLPTHFKYLEE